VATAAAYNAAGDALRARILHAHDAEEATAARKQRLACYQLAYAAPRDQRPPWACNNATASLSSKGSSVEAESLGWACVEEAGDPVIAAAAWFNLGSSGVRGASLVSCLVRPTVSARIALSDTIFRSPRREELRTIERSELPTGRPELPVLVAERMASSDGAQEWLWMWDGAELYGDRYATVIPTGATKPGTCVARRGLEIVDGRVAKGKGHLFPVEAALEGDLAPSDAELVHERPGAARLLPGRGAARPAARPEHDRAYVTAETGKGVLVEARDPEGRVEELARGVDPQVRLQALVGLDRKARALAAANIKRDPVRWLMAERRLDALAGVHLCRC